MNTQSFKFNLCEMQELEEFLRKIQHELSSTHGLYATDRKEQTTESHFQLNYSELSAQVETLLSKVSGKRNQLS